MSGYRPPAPVAAPRSTTPVLLLSALLGIVAGGLLFWALWLPEDAPVPAPVVVPSAEADVYHLTLVMPTPEPSATHYPTMTSVATVGVDVCGQATPGAICKVPHAPLPLPTPYPSCLSSPEAGDLCQWPRATPAVERFTP